MRLIDDGSECNFLDKVNEFDTPSDERALQTPNWGQPGPTSVRPGWPLSACPLSGCV